MPTGAVAFTNAHFGAGIGSIYLDNVDCSGSESNLTDCSSSSIVYCYRGHSEDAGVRCQGIGLLVPVCSLICLYIPNFCSHYHWYLHLWRCSSGWRL